MTKRYSGRDVLAVSIAAFMFALPATAPAQDFPSKPLRLVLRAPPGGADDLQARLLTAHLRPVLGQNVVIEYKTGAGGFVAWEYMAKLPPDPHTIMLTASGLASVRSLRPGTTIDPFRDYTWLSQISSFMLVFTSTPALPVKDIKELIALARKRPGEVNYGSTGVGATPHLAAEYFKAAAKIDAPHIPYKGAGGMFLDLLGGRIGWGTSTPAAAVAHVKAGRLRGLGVTGPRRLAELPDVPTVAEGAGLKGFEFTGFYAMIAAPNIPKDAAARLADAINKVVSSPEFRDQFVKAVAGMEPVASTPAEILALAKQDAAKVEKIVRTANIKAE
jgi:tripartite-type tricarboxylate transporter receptor subunit TctC